MAIPVRLSWGMHDWAARASRCCAPMGRPSPSASPDHPELSGKVAIRFTIASEGNVVTSSVAQSTAGNAELEQCVASRVRGWQFPKPKGGGHVVVTYPFLFKQAGE